MSKSAEEVKQEVKESLLKPANGYITPTQIKPILVKFSRNRENPKKVSFGPNRLYVLK